MSYGGLTTGVRQKTVVRPIVNRVPVFVPTSAAVIVVRHGRRNSRHVADHDFVRIGLRNSTTEVKTPAKLNSLCSPEAPLRKDYGTETADRTVTLTLYTAHRFCSWFVVVFGRFCDMFAFYTRFNVVK